MKVRSQYNSGDPESQARMGDYFFPILDHMVDLGIGSWYSVTTMSIAANDIGDLIDVVRNQSNVLAFTKGGNLVSIDGDFKFSEMGLLLHSGDERFTPARVIANVQAVAAARGNYGAYELTHRAESETLSPTGFVPEQFPSEKVVDLFTQGADLLGSKMDKRAGTIARPFRVAVTAKDVHRDKFRALVLPESALLDGWGVVNGRLLDAGIIRIRTSEGMPEQRAQLIRWLDHRMVYNCRVVGDLEFIDAEGNSIFGLNGHLKLQVCRDDNMPDDIDFIVSEDSVKAEMHPVEDGCGWTVAGFEVQGMKDAFEDQQTITHHPFLLSASDVRNRVGDESKKAYTKLIEGLMLQSIEKLGQDEFDKRFPWEGESFNRLMRWRTSAWALYGMSYTDSVWMFQQLGMQWTQTLNWNSPNWTKTIKVKTPCAVRAQVISATAANLHSGVDMHPEQGYPLWSEKLQVMVMNDEDWVNIVIPSHGGCDQDDFFVIRWVSVNGDRKIFITRNPNTRGEFTIWDYTDGDWFPDHINSKGERVIFPEITKKRWPKQILKALEDGDTMYLDLPTDRDPSATLDDDRAAVLAEQQTILNRIYSRGKPVDAMLARRLGVDDLPTNSNGMISRSKRIMTEIILKYIKDVYDFSSTLEIPSYLEQLGNNEMLSQAKALLKSSRRAMYHADQSNLGADDRSRSEAVKLAQEEILLAPFMATEDRVVRARFALALWYACRTTPTTKGKITDQAIFGTDVFDFLMDGLLYLGVAKKPGFSFVEYEGDHRWTVKCRSCESVYEHLTIQGLVRFWNADRICKNCRNSR